MRYSVRVIYMYMHTRIVYAWNIWMRNSNNTEKAHIFCIFMSLIYLYSLQYSTHKPDDRHVDDLSTISRYSGCSYLTFDENAHASTDILTLPYAVSSVLYWLTDRIAQTSSKSSWYKVTLRKWRGAARAARRWLYASENARGNVSVNVNANSNMPVIIISASTVARRPFPGSSWHPFSFASVARRWPRGSLINRNCDDPGADVGLLTQNLECLWLLI